MELVMKHRKFGYEIFLNDFEMRFITLYEEEFDSNVTMFHEIIYIFFRAMHKNFWKEEAYTSEEFDRGHAFPNTFADRMPFRWANSVYKDSRDLHSAVYCRKKKR